MGAVQTKRPLCANTCEAATVSLASTGCPERPAQQFRRWSKGVLIDVFVTERCRSQGIRSSCRRRAFRTNLCSAGVVRIDEVAAAASQRNSKEGTVRFSSRRAGRNKFLAVAGGL